MFGSIGTFFTGGMFWGFTGVTAIALVVWMFGPMWEVGGEYPLQNPTNRYIAIVILYALYGGLRVIPSRIRNWRNQRMLNKLNKEAAAAAGEGGKADGDDPRLVERFNEATKLLKKARFNHNDETRRLPKWLSWLNFGKYYLYQLPWYVIIGAPGAGKTTALINSGLNFPLSDRFGKSALQGIGGTRNCDWWFTDDAVLLDTAGRYTTQESHQEQDSKEWTNFLGLLRKYRKRQPINGSLITISIADLLSYSPQERYDQAMALHRRLVELHEQLKINFPVYILVTKADLLNGFTSYFSSYDKKQREQIWGFTFPHAESTKSSFDLGAAFDYEFNLLQKRLEAGLPETMIAEQNLSQRASSYLFPQEFAALREILKSYLGIVFSSSTFETHFVPRGIYFTSGTQEGMPFDRIINELNRYLRITPENESALPVTHFDVDDEDQNAFGASQGKSFFLTGVMKDVVFKEEGLAGTNRWWEYRNRTVHWIGYVCLALLFIGAGLLWLTSYRNNSEYLTAVTTNVNTVERQGQNIDYIDAGGFFKLVPYLNNILNIPDTEKFSLENPPVSYKAGLYRGGQVETAGKALYRRALKELLLPLSANQISTILRFDSKTDPDFSFEALKAYRMLYMPEQYDGKFIRAWLMYNLERSSQGKTKTQWQQLEWHLSQLFDDQIQSSPYVRESDLENQVQTYLSQVPQSNRVYGRLKRVLLKSGELKPLGLMDLAGAQAELVFRRKSGKSLSEGVPGLFTPEGYWLTFDRHLDNTAKTLTEEDKWVLDITPMAENNDDLTKTVRLLYMQDFIATWDAFLYDIQLNNVSSLTQRIGTARILSAADSPMRRLLINIVKNVKLTDERDVRSPDRLLNDSKEKSSLNPTRLFTTLFSSNDTAPMEDISSRPEQVVINHYAALIELAQQNIENGGEAKYSTPIPFDSVLKETDGLYNYLTAVQGATNSGLSLPPSDIIPRMQAEAGRLPDPFKSMMLSLVVGASTDTRMKEMENIQRRVKSDVSNFCQQAIAGRYPLVRNASQEIAAGDFARMFAPNSGLMDSFFRSTLEGKVDTSSPVWRFNPGVDGKTLPGGEATLRSFQQARNIRDVYFSNGRDTPYYQLTITPISMDSTILNMTLDIDGQVFRYSHGPQVPLAVSWPGKRDTYQVSLQLNLVNGGSASLTTSGDWALNRLMDRASMSSGKTRLSRVGNFNLDGHRVSLEFTPNSIRNPLQPLPFSCP